MKLATVGKILGGKKILHKDIKNQADLIELADKGLTKEALSHLAKYMRFTGQQMADAITVSERTIQRYTLKEPFNRSASDLILQIAELAARGTAVFGDRDKFLQWINIPSVAFGRKTPVSLLHSKFGRDMIFEELGRIEHGIFS